MQNNIPTTLLRFRFLSPDILTTNDCISEKDIDYIVYHRFGFLLKQTSTPDTAKWIAKFEENGYNCEVVRVPDTAPDGTTLDPKINLQFTPKKPDKSGWEKVTYCKECKNKYFKDFSVFCPHFVGSISPYGYCVYGEKE